LTGSPDIARNIKMGAHMGVVTSDENRSNKRDVYLPMSEPRMAHYSYLSPDGKSVLLVEMDDDHLWEPCRVVPFDGSNEGRKVGPGGGGCTAGAWSPDGKWIYLTSNAVGGNHIWRQRFPGGKPEQIAMSPDGGSIITAVALENSSLWLHDAKGERQIQIEGNPSQPKFTPDATKLVYRIVKEPPSEYAWYRDSGEVRVVDLSTGRGESVVRGLQAFDYDLSKDGKQVVLQTVGPDAKPQFWLAPLDHSSPPKQIPNAEGGFPRFLPNGDILFRRTEGSSALGTTGIMYKIRPDGSGLQKALDAPILIPISTSPDGKWFQAWAPLASTGFPASQLFPLDGGRPVHVATATGFTWSPDARYVSGRDRQGLRDSAASGANAAEDSARRVHFRRSTRPPSRREKDRGDGDGRERERRRHSRSVPGRLPLLSQPPAAQSVSDSDSLTPRWSTFAGPLEAHSGAADRYAVIGDDPVDGAAVRRDYEVEMRLSEGFASCAVPIHGEGRGNVGRCAGHSVDRACTANGVSGSVSVIHHQANGHHGADTYNGARPRHRVSATHHRVLHRAPFVSGFESLGRDRSGEGREREQVLV
jgi:hypothetical protein